MTPTTEKPTRTSTPKKSTVRATAPTDAPPQPEPAAKPSRTHREFTNVQERIAAEVADLMTNGGYEDDVAALAAVAIRHHGRRVFQDTTLVENYAMKWEHIWIKELLFAIAANKTTPEPERQTPDDVIGRIRDGIYTELEGKFEEFIHGAKSEELWFMREVLNSRFCIPDTKGAVPREGSDIPVANAFAHLLGEASHGYFRVPARMVNIVQQYIDCLRKAEITDSQRQEED